MSYPRRSPLPYCEKVGSKYGAPMGRNGDQIDPDGRVKWRLRQVPLNSGGYDPGGAYWGTGEPLFCAWGADIEDPDAEEFRVYFRARNRAQAKRWLLNEAPGSLFYR